MDAITIGGGILVLIFVIVFYKVMTKDEKKNKKNNKNNADEKEELKGKIKVKNKDLIQQKDIFSFMEFDRIVDNMILQENEKKYTMIVQCKGINYDLMSEVEQMSVEEGFITFLNTLKFPIQIYVQARAVELKKSMDIYNDSLNNIEMKYNEYDEEYKNLSKDININYEKMADVKRQKDRFEHILDYAKDITKYVEKISLNKHVLQRKFYIVLSYYKSEVATATEFNEQELHEICYRELYTRAQSIISALMSCSVYAKILDSNQLAELLYISYNRDDEKLIDIRTALDSGFYRLYSTSKDVFTKKNELMQKQVEAEAENRVKEAILQTLKNTEIKSEDQLVEEFEERADREAIDIVNDIDINNDLKDEIINNIALKHVEGVENRKNERERKIQKQSDSEINDNEIDKDEEKNEKFISKLSSDKDESLFENDDSEDVSENDIII